MLEQIRGALTEIGREYGDRRVQLCRLDAAALDWGRCALTGAVLDGATLAGVHRGLAERFPGLAFDAGSVEVLRRPEPMHRVVATNLTGLYAEPSFLAEQLSQLLNGWPLEILQEQERWCFVRQADGYLGWAYRSYLTGETALAATHIVSAPVSLLRAAPTADAALITRVPAGTAVASGEVATAGIPVAEPVEAPPFDCEALRARNSTTVVHLTSGWSNVTLAGGLTGWAPDRDLRALTAWPADESGRRAQIVADAARFIGVPYLWGGCTALGIDCSGFAQLLHRLVGLTLPRDADMQYFAGRPVEPPYAPADLLFFGEAPARPKITHVAISLGGWHILHSSRSRNGVYEDDVQAVPHLRESFIAARTFVG